ncbi:MULTISPECIES: TetR family transcriptional regulator [unclassified Mycolicibacterium]|uniref:TetR family transcriptional regulator n=1 Tax=unclassified Mycolicibacterium TaxID=2636767 RepID=UPI001306286E|nr:MULTISPECIES: TetR family transcriptional regulator [unclassified Mycolicibacterium]MUL85845.1 TetR family transcriptional regulator [Mycolicibacterium sp. CBMA 329]MUL90215.1 TetR family transcriptional regulator [Mycolicibacterium sp. CBMA 331]MUM00984.1 TetR family transcriptional regulator [Mycolicibacterium sp. CBMA 334]MUM27142.1 TetR family transcriptional regulator [Mycolicibacterium sp. CBMA 295]MUM39730.1 TetR family transcriptional regulator [Mycolicibacterium sp. CBMA 247]
MADVMQQVQPGLRERKKQRTRAMLIEAAIDLCDRQGFEQTTVEQIAAVADVSPRTFSRYFATKDAVVLAFVDEVAEIVAIELAAQPAGIGDIEALYRAHVRAFLNTKTAPPTQLTSKRLLASARIITSSPVLMQSASEFRADAVNVVLARRMGVPGEDRRLKLTAVVWGSIVMTGIAELGSRADWGAVTVDDIVGRIEAAYADFLEVVARVPQHAT